MSDKQVINLSWLLSELADQPKQGITFGQEAWNRFRDNMIGSRREFPPPAYKSGNISYIDDGKNLHIIDFLMARAKHVVDSTLTDLHKFLQSSGASTLDKTITRHWDEFEESFGVRELGGIPRFPWFFTLREGLKADVDACLAEWNTLMSSKSASQDYSDKVKIVYEIWNAIQPRLPAPMDDSTYDTSAILLRELMADDDEDMATPELGRWELLKASWAYKQHHYRQRFVWQMAGRQLHHLKALAVAGSVLVAPHMYAALKTDNVYIKRLMARVTDGDHFAGASDGLREGHGGLGGLSSSASPGEEDE